MPYLAGISFYPIKALDPAFATEIEISRGGTLQHDREFAMVDAGEKFVNGKRNEKVYLLRSTFALQRRRITLQVQGEAEQHAFHLDKDREKLESWLSNYFGMPVTLRHNAEHGFPDDTKASGPTVISTGTLKAVAGWFPGLKPEDVWRRFRPNLVLGGCEAFWEERLYAGAEQSVSFRIGAVRFEGLQPCPRCTVPKHHPLSGERLPDFSRTFLEQRKATLPAWAERTRFDHFYRLAINTRIPPSEAGKELKIGDEVKVELPTT